MLSNASLWPLVYAVINFSLTDGYCHSCSMSWHVRLLLNVLLVLYFVIVQA